ncbi:MAG: ferrous iron transport protein B [Armatimonadetes bacterium]|nr:ferrous iron transport protein B [Armatimonadota bacterium]
MTSENLSSNKDKEIVVAIAGNPNSGKTTVFNELTGARQHVGNWSGVTVERKEGVVELNGVRLRVVDLPGIYSLSAYSQEEIIARDFLINGNVDVIINVVDASNLERNLYLTTQLLELGIGTVIALNMIDEAESQGQKIDAAAMARLLGTRVVPTQATRGTGIKELLRQTVEVARCRTCEPPRSTRHNPEIENEIAKLEARIGSTAEGFALPVRWLIVKSLEGDEDARRRLIETLPNGRVALAAIDDAKRHLERHFGGELEAVIADARYGFIGGLLREVVIRTKSPEALTLTDRIDSVVLHRWIGIPIFLTLMLLVFELTFDVGGRFAEFIEVGIDSAGGWLQNLMPPGPLVSLLVDGVIAGVGGVIVFLPNIVVMFTLISFLENSGYMARAAFLMDRSMHAMGLHGKSFIPMLMGFGCNVPAIMATRTLETFEDRLLTILVTPLMSCTARLPIYILFTGIFFSRQGALVIFSIYALGVMLAVASGKLFRKTLFAKAVSPFVMELPPYRLPTLKGTVIHVWERTSIFLTKAGTVILAASVVIWALGCLPWGVRFGSEQSIVGYMGRFLQPIVAPLGLDWRAAVALFFGVGAKEVVVSTLGVLYASSVSEHTGLAFREGITRAFTPLTAYVFMVISLIYVPCVATVAAIKRETNSWQWTLFAIGYAMCLAYLVGYVVYRLGLVLGFK